MVCASVSLVGLADCEAMAHMGVKTGSPHEGVMILPVLTVSILPYQVYGQIDVRTTEPLVVIDPR